MADIHHSVLTAPKSINLVNGTMVYDILLSSSYHVHDYGDNYTEDERIDYGMIVGSVDLYSDPNMNNMHGMEMVKVPITMLPPPPHKMYSCNNNNNNNNNNVSTRGLMERRERNAKGQNGNSRTNLSKGYESDESGTSLSSRSTPPDTNGRQYNNESNDDQTSDPSDLFNVYPYSQTHRNSHNDLNRVNGMQPNLYQPAAYHHYGRSKYSTSTTSNRSKMTTGYHQHRNAEAIVRRVHGLMERFKSRSHLMQITLKPKGLLNGGPWDQLNQAIWNLFGSRAQTEETYLNKLNLWRSLFLYMRKCFTSYGLFMVGSTMSGLGLEGSDIDMCLLKKPFVSDPRVDSLHHLGQIRHFLIKGGIAVDAELIMAKVPILKFRHKESGFEIDLNCNNAVGIRNTHLLHSYSRLDWRVKPLIIVVKIWAQANNINEAKNMTISSYSWALMVIHYLQCGVTPPVLPCLHGLVPSKFNSDHEGHNMDVQEEINDLIGDFKSDNTSCLGDLLIGFFHYYAHFDYSQYAISVRAGCRIPINECRYLKSPKNDPNQWKLLCIEEPFDFSNTARSVFDPDVFKHIRNVVACSYRELARNKILSHILPVDLNIRRR